MLWDFRYATAIECLLTEGSFYRLFLYQHMGTHWQEQVCNSGMEESFKGKHNWLNQSGYLKPLKLENEFRMNQKT